MILAVQSQKKHERPEHYLQSGEAVSSCFLVLLFTDSRLLYLPLLVACVLHSQIFISDVLPNNEIPSGGRRAQETLWLNNGLFGFRSAESLVFFMLPPQTTLFDRRTLYYFGILILIQDQTFLFFFNDRSLLSLISSMHRILDSSISVFGRNEA